MRVWDFSGYALSSCVALVLLAGCGTPQPPIGTTSATQGHAIGVQAAPGASRGVPWTSGDLIYATTIGLKKAFYILTYPGGTWVAKVKVPVPPRGLCSDESGNVYVATGENVYVYRHGATKPTRTLAESAHAIACAADPTTGNLAVITEGTSESSGVVAVYANAEGLPTMYADPDIWFPEFCSYDNVGNLFIIGSSKASERMFSELPAEGATFTNITLNEPFDGPVQWDGQYITVGAPLSRRGPFTILRVQISGSAGTVVGTSVLKRLGPLKGYTGEYWVQGATVIKMGWKSGLWSYPEGGKPLEYLSPNHTALHFWGVTVSVAPSR